MYRYLVLNTMVTAAAAWLVPRPRRRWFSVLAVMIVLTAVFDNMIIALDIVRYVPGHWLGLSIGVAPLEDFAYAIVASIVLPALWERASRSNT